jgi:tetratricopeptide (TPR) repeat protein
MERRVVEGGQFALHAPTGWQYQEPEQADRPHVFLRPGVAAISVRAVPPEQGPDVLSVVRMIEAQWADQEAERLGRRYITVGDQLGMEINLRRRVRGQGQRYREVVFPSSSGRVYYVSCVCAERRYRLLEVIFDKVIQSIRDRPPLAAAARAQSAWQRLTENPQDAEACVILAGHYAHAGRHGAAEQLLRVAIGVRSDYADAHSALAHLYATAPGSFRRPREAIRHARKAIAIAPDTPAYHATLAIGHEASGHKAQALASARRAAELAPDDAGYADLVRRIEARE